MVNQGRRGLFADLFKLAIKDLLAFLFDIAADFAAEIPDEPELLRRHYIAQSLRARVGQCLPVLNVRQDTRGKGILIDRLTERRRKAQRCETAARRVVASLNPVLDRDRLRDPLMVVFVRVGPGAPDDFDGSHNYAPSFLLLTIFNVFG